MIRELLAEGWTRAEIVAAYQRSGFTASEANFIYAIETNEIAGDQVAVDASGKEIQRADGGAEYLELS